jgi:hypothetical protein
MIQIGQAARRLDMFINLIQASRFSKGALLDLSGILSFTAYNYTFYLVVA